MCPVPRFQYQEKATGRPWSISSTSCSHFNAWLTRESTAYPSESNCGQAAKSQAGAIGLRQQFVLDFSWLDACLHCRKSDVSLDGSMKRIIMCAVAAQHQLLPF